jgi:hypothetical protein
MSPLVAELLTCAGRAATYVEKTIKAKTQITAIAALLVRAMHETSSEEAW